MTKHGKPHRKPKKTSIPHRGNMQIVDHNVTLRDRLPHKGRKRR
jgi:predicted hotdog family 3-hydroxylacyl-ACP dehydratase